MSKTAGCFSRLIVKNTYNMWGLKQKTFQKVTVPQEVSDRKQNPHMPEKQGFPGAKDQFSFSE